MRAVVQRVRSGRVRVGDEITGEIGFGLLVYAAAARDDSEADVRWLAEKIARLRVFADEEGKLNLDVGQIGGEVLLVSAFSVQADARKGRRPSFDSAAPGGMAAPLIADLGERLRALGLAVASGRFAAAMRVESTNDGPICILLDSRRLF